MRDYRRNHINTPILVVETGNELKQSEYLEEPANRRIVEAFDLLGSHAVHTSIQDLRRLIRLAELGGIPTEPRSQYVATLVEPPQPALFPVKSFVVQTVRAAQGDAAVRIGILGIGIDSGELPQPWKTIGTDEALRRYLPDLVAQSDLVLLLTRLPDEELARLAQAYPQIGVMINGSSTGKGRDLPRVGNTVIVESAYSGTAVGTLAVEWDAGGHITRWQNEIVPLPAMIPESPALAALVEKWRQDVLTFEEEKARKSTSATTLSIFAGSNACKECHEKAFEVWENSGHARAAARLKPSRQFDQKCLPCHVTGFGADRGFVNVLQTSELTNVHCEACHGSSIDHSKNPGTIHPGIGLMQQIRRRISKDFCNRCHDADNSPRFDFQQYWKKIEH